VCDKPIFIACYAQLCQFFRQHQIEQQQLGQRRTKLRLFSYYLLNKCQTDFEQKSAGWFYHERLQAIDKAETVTKSFSINLLLC